MSIEQIVLLLYFLVVGTICTVKCYRSRRDV
jgi:hypothetical protein